MNIMEQSPNQNLLNQIEKISLLATDCNLDFKKLQDIQEDITTISEFLKISFDQTVIFSCLVELSLQKTVTLDHLARHLKCSALKIINLIGDIEALEKNRYVQKIIKSNNRNYTYNDLGFSVPHNIIEALRTCDNNKLKTTSVFTLPLFLEHITELVSNRQGNSITTQDVLDQVDFLISANNKHLFIQYINDNVKLTLDKCVVFVLAYFRLKRQFSYDLESLVSPIFDDFSEQMEYIQNLSMGNNELFQRNLVKFQDSHFTNERIIGLSSKAIEMLYKHHPELYIKENEDDCFIRSGNIKSIKLFYDNNLKKQVESLSSILMTKNYNHFQKRLKNSNLPKGITAIFYGQSGTGKTETVYQIAKKTNRDILMVDLSQTKSKWFGESEKKVKGIFDEYKRYFNNSNNKPILFINEVDGLFSKRTEISKNSDASDQTLNSIQNIILQELENFEGILLTTTNLTGNLDNAFERRFLFKIEFNKPDSQIRGKIWKNKIPELNNTQIKLLSEKFVLSGGEIENIARKWLINNIIENRSSSPEKLIKYCEMERPFHKKNLIGFKV